MSYRIEKTEIGTDVVIDGWEEGVIDDPYKGIYDIRNCDNVTIPGEVSVAMSTQNTNTPINLQNVDFTVDPATNIFTWNGLSTLTENTAIQVTSNTATVKSLIIAGGGGGAMMPNTYAGGGGGGAGGYLENNNTFVTGQTYNITVGGGGLGAITVGNGSNGSDSSAFGFTAIGGGGGGSYGTNGSNGGSGGGGGGNAASTYPSGGIATIGQGNNGGTGWLGSSVTESGGGGGGSGSIGVDGLSAIGGNGGNGTTSSISGSAVLRAGGGGGGGDTIGVGQAGGGNGSNTGATAGNATANSGSGGGGGGNTSNGGGTGNGGNGGSGIVVISYVTANFGVCTATGAYTTLTSGANTIFIFTGNGTFTVVSPVVLGVLPTPLDKTKTYYIKQVLSPTTFTISESIGGAILDITDAGSGLNSFSVINMGIPTEIVGSGSSQQVYFAVDNNGRIWGYFVGIYTNWLYLNNLASELSTNQFNNIIAWKGYIFLLTDGNLGYCQIDSFGVMSLKSSWHLTWKSITSTTIHKALIGQDDAIYFCNDAAVGSIIALPAGGAFNPTNGATYTFNALALALPSTDKATCLAELGTNLMIGGINNYIYPWDRVSPSFTFPIFLSENYTTRLVTINTTMYIFCGYKGRIFITNGANATPFFKIPEYLSETTNPYIIWKDANFNRNQLYFSFQVTNNAGTTINGLSGLWSVDVDSVTPVSPRLQNQMSFGTYNGYVSAICQYRGGNYTVPPSGDGYGLFMGWYSGSVGGIDIGISNPYTGGQSYVICDPIPIGQYLTNKTLQGIEYKLGAPLATGETITLGYRTQLSGSFTDNALDTYVAGSLSQWGTVKFEKSQWIQLQAILTSTVTNPSYCRLREIRIHLQ